MKLDPYLKPYTKIISKWIKDLNKKIKTIKLLEENIGVNLHKPGFDKGFLDMTLKAQATEEKIDKFKLIKTKNFCSSKGIIT